MKTTRNGLLSALMASIFAAGCAAALAKLEALGYSLDKLRKVPQQWPEASP